MAGNVRSIWPLATSQSLMVCPTPQASVRPSGEIATEVTESVWPSSVRNNWPLARFRA